MGQTCSKCSRVNPAEATYCYHDGIALGGDARNGAPLAVGSQAFAHPFVFPSGQTCRNFDELSMACQKNWREAADILQQGLLQSFFGGLGRADLAMAAREASRFPDRDRGLDQLLAKLPSRVLQSAKLRVEPQEINLGTLQVGASDKQLELQLDNQGMRLLYGSVTCEESPWLTVGKAPGAAQRLFQFGSTLTVPVNVWSKRLRAGNKPLEGRIVVESNAGTVTIAIRAQVPIKPFADGVLAGAKTPRQIAEKAKAAPKEAAALFVKGAVAKWYKENGWTYPVKGPSSYDLGAVQQFFEALGLTPPPKVDISERSVAMRGNVGDQLRHTLEVKSQEKRPVYASAVSDSAWLEVGRAKLNGRTATIPLVVPNVPNREGQSITAKVTVTANGNQRFIVPVTLTIGGQFSFGAPVAAVPVPAAAIPAPAVVLPPRRQPSFSGMHLLPLLLLLVVLLGLGIYDMASSGKATPAPAGPPADLKPGTAISAKVFGKFQWKNLKDDIPRLEVQFNRSENPKDRYSNNNDMRFGIVMREARDPKNPDEAKRLTYSESGKSNNTCLNVDGYYHLFGQKPGKWTKEFEKIKDRHAWISVMEWPEQKIQLTQHVEIVPGEQTLVLDTILIHYTVRNIGDVSHTVGLRVMLDTFIGLNDGVPFVIPTQPGLLTTMQEFDQKSIPDYVQAIEFPNLQKPGTIAHVGLKGLQFPSVDLEKLEGTEESRIQLITPEDIERMRICRWPQNKDIRWEWPMSAMNDPPDKPGDSCVVLYWANRRMNPGETRELAFTYGLNMISTDAEYARTVKAGATQIGLTAGGLFRPGEKFTVTAYVVNPGSNKTVKLTLPKGLTLANDDKPQSPEQPVEQQKGGYSQASWRLRADEVGEFDIEASCGPASAKHKVRIIKRSFID